MSLSMAALSAMPLMLAGCASQPYPAGLVYPLRTDLIVVQFPSVPPEGPPPPGKLDSFIAKFDTIGGRTCNPAELSGDSQAALRQILDDRFGTPAEPKVDGDEQTRALVGQLDLSSPKLATGGALYKRHCLHCHGLTGDGRGPTGQWVYPAARDFRQGIFKYVSSAGSAARKPGRADMHRVVEMGIERTSMPSFALLSAEEREQVVAYTIHLSLRGEVEYRLLLALLSPGAETVDDLAAEADAWLKVCLQRWLDADREAIVPVSLPTPEAADDRIKETHLESVRRGAALFASPTLNCLGCHVDYGRQARYLYDSWGNAVRAADLTEAVYRGGKRPLDLFLRIRGGIGASAMPAATSLTESEVWDLVHFVLALPMPGMLPADTRATIYPAGR